ncbi:MAG: iron-sulfur cluster insertion protein ErpA [Acidobacteria bacterium]|nr:iron-sulfur cluster insertion protein ErpA [Acidobacteriota bacterium]
MITLTDTAISEVRKLMDQQKVDGLVLRLGVQGGGCSGMSYVMNFDTEVSDEDDIIEQDGVRVVVDKRSHTLLEGVEVDYVSNLMGSGFKFSNPNATKSCGCGSSFSV